MGNAALAYDYYEDIPDEQIELPAGGIANFLNATQGDWATANENIPKHGIAKVQSVANELAKYGRYEDEYMVHAAHGETVVPMAVLDANPRLKKSLYSQMESMGLEPGRYIVGDELNSINPVTGQPEFFLKKLFKGLKKLVKKVFKVVVPIIATVLLTPVMGVIGASAFVSGASTLIQGGSLKDALKSAALGGLTAGVFKGIQGGIGSLKQGDKFFSGFKEGFKGALTPGGSLFGGADKVDPSSVPVEEAIPAVDKVGEAAAQAAEGTLIDPGVAAVDAPILDVGPVGPGTTTSFEFPKPGVEGMALNPNVSGGPLDQAVAGPMPAPVSVQTPAAPSVASTPGVTPFTATTAAAPATTASAAAPATTASAGAGQVTPGGINLPDPGIVPEATSLPGAGAGAAAATEFVPETGFFENLKAAFTKDTLGVGGTDLSFREGLMNAFLPQFSTNMKDQYAQNIFGKNFMDLSAEQMKEVSSKMLSSMSPIRRYAPVVAGLSAFSALTAPEQVELENPFETTGQDLIDADPGKYIIPFGRPTTFEITRTGGNYVPTPPPPGAQDGGDISYFPRRNGGIAGPGTGTSDDIPAMLSDGEFVMTAKAVRGAGNGSRKKGMRNMYSMMRNFEANA